MGAFINKMQLASNPTFKDLHCKMLKQRQATDYTSKTSVNSVILSMAESCRKVIFDEVAVSGCYSGLIDESKDKAKREELAFYIRYCKDGEVCERFIRLEQLKAFDAEAILCVTKEVIDSIQHHAPCAVILMLVADGASVMSGEFAGVAQLLNTRFFSWLI